MSIYFQHKSFFKPESSIKHGFFGSQGGVSKGLYTALNCGLGSEDSSSNVRANRVLALESLGLERTLLHNVNQVHSAKCIILDPDHRKNFAPEADALVTDLPGHTISILTADCAPVLFYGAKEGDGRPVIGAAHAGWRGAFSGVLGNTVQCMVQKGASLSGIKAVIGPTIGPKSYEVGDEFRTTIIRKQNGYNDFFRELGSQIFFDLPAFCERRLRDAGVENVLHKSIDTFFNEDDFFSYRRATHRRDKDYGRQISMISIT